MEISELLPKIFFSFQLEAVLSGVQSKLSFPIFYFFLSFLHLWSREIALVAPYRSTFVSEMV